MVMTPCEISVVRATPRRTRSRSHQNEVELAPSFRVAPDLVIVWAARSHQPQKCDLSPARRGSGRLQPDSAATLGEISRQRKPEASCEPDPQATGCSFI